MRIIGEMYAMYWNRRLKGAVLTCVTYALVRVDGAALRDEGDVVEGALLLERVLPAREVHAEVRIITVLIDVGVPTVAHLL